jgi:DNA polymerase III delta prime subunit
MLSPVIRVFVSSTSRDLQAERQAVEAAVQRMGETKFVGMEYFGTRDETSRDASLQEVDRSDLYIGIFAGRYGSGITEDEYRRAQGRGLDRFIYFKDEAAISAEQRESDPATAARLARLQEDLRREHVVSVFANPDDLAARLTADLHRWLVDKRLTTPRDQAYPIRAAPTSIEPEDRRGLRDLLDRVNVFWIRGVLQHSAHGAALIEIGKQTRSEAVEHPWERVLELPGHSSRSIPKDTSIGGVFQESARSLLILGEPGSGKTTTLLELARDLSHRAEHDSAQPVPVVFNLSSWTRRSTIFSWLLDELSTKYFVARRHARSWLNQNRLMPLLDGLDEVAADDRAACVGAINRFAHEVGLPGVAVCSRTNEYIALGTRLQLHGAVCLQPLTSEQVDAYFAEAGPQLSALRAAVQRDSALRSLAESPLMLAVMTLAYGGDSAERLSSVPVRASEDLQGRVLATYVDRMFARMGRAAHPYGKADSLVWLTWLAQTMRKHSQSIFLIEQLQPGWLSSGGPRWLYTLTSRGVSGLLLGLILGLLVVLLLVMSPAMGPGPASWKELLARAPESVMEESERWMGHALEGLPECARDEVTREFAGMSWKQRIGFFVGTAMLGGVIVGLGVGLFDSLRFRRSREPDRVGPPRHYWLVARNTVVYSVLGAVLLVTGQAIYLALHGQCRPDQVLGSLVDDVTVTGLLFGVLFALRGTARTVRSDIKTLERLVWSWRRGLLGGMVGMVAFSLLAFYTNRYSGFGRRLLIALAVGSAAFPLGAGLGGLTRGSVKETVSPNQGIKVSLRGAMFGGLSWAFGLPLLGFACYLLSGMVVVVILGAYHRALEWAYIMRAWQGLTHDPVFVYAWAPFALALGLLLGLNAYGGLDVIQHYILRAIIWRKGYAPRDYARFLDYAVRLIFLQKVGGGYIFIHRLLLEHFAARGQGRGPDPG